MTFKDWVQAFEIFARYSDKAYCMGAEHDQVFIYVGEKELPPDSPDGKILTEMGWFIQDDGWSKFV